MFTTRVDTTILFRNGSDDSVRVLGGYDWGIFIPAENKVVYLSDITSSFAKGNHDCANPILSFIQYGKTICSRLDLNRRILERRLSDKYRKMR